MVDLTQIEPQYSAALIIDLQVIVDNFHVVAQQTQPSKIYPVVKANAYGLGMAKIAPTLSEAGAEGFFVAHLQEGIELRAIIPRKPIYVFYGLLPGQEADFKAHNLIPVLNTTHQLNTWSKTNLDGALHIDTGLNRLGLSLEDLPEAQQYKDRIKLIMSHLACSDEPNHPHNAFQLKNFQEKTQAFSCPKSLAASGGAFLSKDYHFDIIRPGISLYGGNPHPEKPSPVKNPVMWATKILQVKYIKSGDKVGYGCTFEAPHNMTIGILAHGYADGYLRSASSRGECMYKDNKCSVLGRISMDLIAVDLTNTDAKEGEWVELIGEGISLDKLADFMRTISYEVITSLHARAKLVYKEPSQGDHSHRKVLS